MSSDLKTTREKSILGSESLKELAIEVQKKISSSQDDNISQLSQAFGELIVEAGLQTERNQQTEKEWHWFILLIICIIHYICKPFISQEKTTIDKTLETNEALLRKGIDIENTLMQFKEKIKAAGNDQDSKETNEILERMNKMLKMVKIIKEAFLQNEEIAVSPDMQRNNDDGYVYSDTNHPPLIPSLTNPLNMEQKENSTAFHTLALVSSNNRTHSNDCSTLNRDIFLEKIDALIASIVSRLTSKKINIPEKMRTKLFPEIEKFKQILHKYDGTDQWAKRYRQQKRKIIKPIHPDKQRDKAKATVITQVLLHSFFNLIDAFLDKMKAGKALNLHDDEMDTFWQDLHNQFSQYEEELNQLSADQEDMMAFFQNAQNSLNEMDEQIEELHQEFQSILSNIRYMCQSTKTQIKELQEMSKQLDRIGKEYQTAIIETRAEIKKSREIFKKSCASIAENKNNIKDSQMNISEKIASADRLLSEIENGIAIEDTDIENTAKNNNRLFSHSAPTLMATNNDNSSKREMSI